MSLNDGFEYTETVSAAGGGHPTVLDYLSDRYRHSTRKDWLERILDGRVTVDGARVGAETPLRNGETITWHRPPWEEPEAPVSFEVVHEDEDLLGVAKPAGLPVLPGGGFLSRTLLSLVRERDPDAAPVHRLGRWTSGVVLFGRTASARRALSKAWRCGGVVKRYRALASGCPRARAFDVDQRIGPVPHPKLGSVHAARDDGSPSRTRVEVIEIRIGCFLADVRIDTGRPHQIRIHLAAAGHPLLGDPLFAIGGRPGEGCAALPGDPGYQLHAAELSFPHPRTGEPVTIGCSPPRLLRSVADR